jgi:hypothetical protein
MMLARFLQYPSSWADLAGSDENISEAESCLACPFNVVLDVGLAKGGGASYWKMQVDDKQNVRRVVAAYFSVQSEIKAVSIKYIDSEILRSMGVKFKKTAGAGSDAELRSDAHYDVTTSNVGQAFKLAKYMAGTSIKLGVLEVADCVCEAVLDGRFP